MLCSFLELAKKDIKIENLNHIYNILSRNQRNNELSNFWHIIRLCSIGVYNVRNCKEKLYIYIKSPYRNFKDQWKYFSPSSKSVKTKKFISVCSKWTLQDLKKNNYDIWIDMTTTSTSLAKGMKTEGTCKWLCLDFYFNLWPGLGSVNTLYSRWPSAFTSHF